MRPEPVIYATAREKSRGIHAPNRPPNLFQIQGEAISLGGSMSSAIQNALNERSLFTEHEAARYTGTSVSTLRRRRKARRDPAWIQIDRSIRYRRSVLDKFLDDHTVKPEESEPGSESWHVNADTESKRVQ
jgi:hypothetical protein